MRKCLRCSTKMIEELDIRTNDALGLAVAEKGLFKTTLGKIVCAVCPECGYVEIYVENSGKIRNTVK